MPVTERDHIRLPTGMLASSSGEKAQDTTKNKGFTNSPVVAKRELESLIESESKRQGGGNSGRRGDAKAAALGKNGIPTRRNSTYIYGAYGGAIKKSWLLRQSCESQVELAG